jgi:TetR/AcrR family transcriptional regulator
MEVIMQREAFYKLSEDKKNTIIKSGISEFSSKSFSEASTDVITRNSGISKGILFHYFGSKKDFYLYCLEWALERLDAELPDPEEKDFYGIIFYFMDEKFNISRQFPEEMRMVNMAARETNTQIFEERTTLFAKYMFRAKEKSGEIMTRAVRTLPLKEQNAEKVMEALSIYTGAIINKYLESYKEIPDEFISQSEKIKAEIKELIDFMLYGVVKEVKE